MKKAEYCISSILVKCSVYIFWCCVVFDVMHYAPCGIVLHRSLINDDNYWTNSPDSNCQAISWGRWFLCQFYILMYCVYAINLMCSYIQQFDNPWLLHLFLAFVGSSQCLRNVDFKLLILIWLICYHLWNSHWTVRPMNKSRVEDHLIWAKLHAHVRIGVFTYNTVEIVNY